MSAFASKIREVITRHGMFAPDDRVLAGVSGGADSVALVLTLRDLGYHVGIAHLNHGLRGADSDQDEAFVLGLAKELAVPCFTRRAQIPPTGNVEAAGRGARREFFRSILRSEHYTKIALGHTRDDRVETFLLNLLRGSGAEGLVSMAPSTGDIVRPLIESSREEIEGYLRAREQVWRTDSTNFDMSFARNRIRHEVIPHLASLFNTRLPESLARTITVLADEDRWLGQQTEAWISRFSTSEKGEISLPVATLRAEPEGLVRRVIRASLRHVGSELTDLSFEHVEAIRRLLEDNKSGKIVQVPKGMVACREFGRLVFRTKPAAGEDFSYVLKIPGVVHVPELARRFCARIVNSPLEIEDPNKVFVDRSRLGDCVRIRNWKPGDYYRPLGWPAGKVKKLFQRARIPRSQRVHWPVLVADSGLVWVLSFPVSRDYAAGRNSEKIVAFEALPD